MKKLLGIVVLGLLWCNIGFAKCIQGNCIDGYGTYQDTDGTKYVGEWKNEMMHGHGTLIYSQGAIWIGEWQNNKMEGEFIIYKKEGNEGFRMICKNHDCEVTTSELPMSMDNMTPGFDFVCYNSCKDRNDENFCMKKCSLE